jgi:hypothetical protein
MIRSVNRVVLKAVALPRLQPTVRLSSMSGTSSKQQLETEQYMQAVDYKTKGDIVKLPDKTELYASGNPHSKNAVLLIPDFFGWYTGRVRNVCDFFGDNSMYAVIPNFGSHGKVSSIPQSILLFLYLLSCLDRI